MKQRLVSLAVSLLVLAGCSGEQKPDKECLTAPRVTESVKHTHGSAVAGGNVDLAAAAVTSADPSQCLQVVTTFVALERLPEHLLEPLSEHTRMLASGAGGKALVAAPRLLAGGRGAIVPDGTSFTQTLEGPAFADLRGALPKDVTATFAIECDRAHGDRGERMSERVAVHVSRRELKQGEKSERELDWAIEVDGVPPSGQSQEREIAVLDVRPLARGEALVLVVRSPFVGDEAKAIAAVVAVLPPPAADAPGAAAHRRACAECAGDLAREAALLRGHARSIAPNDLAPPRPDLGEARRALQSPSRRRAALFLVAQMAGAPLVEDLSLSVDDAALAPVCESVERALAAPGAPVAGPVLAWAVERAAFVGLRDLVGEGEVPPAVEGALVRRGGAVGRSFGTFFGLAEKAQSLEDLDASLRSGNEEALGDSSPAVRARAFDWLSARKLAPEGYDPLASTQDRRAALDKLESKGENP